MKNLQLLICSILLCVTVSCCPPKPIALPSTQKLLLYPVPADSVIFITNQPLNINLKYTITNINDSLIMQGILKDNVINIQQLQNGVYWIVVQNNTIKFINKIHKV